MVLGGLLVIVGIPAALVLGIIGVVADKKKLLAVATTVISAILVIFYVSKISGWC